MMVLQVCSAGWWATWQTSNTRAVYIISNVFAKLSSNWLRVERAVNICATKMYPKCSFCWVSREWMHSCVWSNTQYVLLIFYKFTVRLLENPKLDQCRLILLTTILVLTKQSIIVKIARDLNLEHVLWQVYQVRTHTASHCYFNFHF